MVECYVDCCGRVSGGDGGGGNTNIRTRVIDAVATWI